MGVFTNEEEKQDMLYMHDVDEAMNRRGHPWAFTLTASIILFFLVFFIWANSAMIDDVTRGQGQIIPAQGVQPIQSERGGAILDLFVEENQEVEQGEILLTMSNVAGDTGLREHQTRFAELSLSLKRLDAEEKEHPLEFTPEEREANPEAIVAQQRIYDTRREQFEGQSQLLLAQIEQRKKDVTEARERRETTEQKLAVERDRLKTYERLAGGAVSRLQYIEVQQAVVALEGELASIEESIARTQQGVQAAEERLGNLAAERQFAIADEISKTRTELLTVEQQIRAGSEQVTRSEMRSPVRGTIKKIILRKDNIAKPAETILEIIPTDGALEVEAKFSPQDRGFLFVNQPAMVKVSSYDFSVYGGLEATVTKISSDTIEDKKGEPWYEVRFLTKRKSILYQGKEHEILPGMTVTVDVLTDKRSVLSHIIGPIRRALQNAMTEH